MPRSPLLLVLTVMFVPQLGCSSKTANKSNFQAALQAAYDRQPRCTQWFHTLPADLDPKAPDYPQYEALRAAGLLTAQTSMKVQTDAFQTFIGIRHAPVPISTYSIGGPNSSAWSPEHGLCYAKVHVTQIDNFTEPSAVTGMTASRVSFSYELIDVPAWAKEPALQNAVPQIKNDLQRSDHKDTETLVLTDSGWRMAGNLQ